MAGKLLGQKAHGAVWNLHVGGRLGRQVVERYRRELCVRVCGREADVTRCLELAGLRPEYAEREAGKLSVGEQQRVMLARSLALEPEVLLLDEPTSALDEDSRDEVERTLVGLEQKLNASFVLVTHDRAQADRLAERVVRIREGRIEA